MDGNHKEGEMPVGEEELTARVTSEKSCWSDGGHCTGLPPEEFGYHSR